MTSMVAGVLMLNASYQPLRVVPLPRAIMLLHGERARIVEGSGRFLHSPSVTIEQPDVIALIKQVWVPESVVPPYSRKGVLMRDGYRCAYCGKYGDTIDHVVPQALGGEDSWTNCVCACTFCNGFKDCRTLSELDWVLPFTPKAPSPQLAPFLWLERTPTVWLPYLEPYLSKRRARAA